MFVIETSELPLSVECLRPTASGTFVSYVCTLGELSDEHTGRECTRCGVRLVIGTLVYHDSTCMSMWHLDCFRRTIAASTATTDVTRWYVRNVQWPEPK